MTLEIAPSAIEMGSIGLAFGLAVGSFLNVVIHRLPLGISVATPASHCPLCETPINDFWMNLKSFHLLSLEL